MAAYFKKKPFQVAGDQDIHGGAAGLLEFPVAIIDAGLEKIRQDFILVGGADQLMDGKSDPAGIPSRQDVAEIACGNHKIDPLAGNNFFLFQQRQVSPEVIDHLRQEPAPVNRVG